MYTIAIIIMIVFILLIIINIGCPPDEMPEIVPFFAYCDMWRVGQGMVGARWQLTEKFWFLLRHDLVVDVVAPLSRLLEDHSGFFQKICGVMDRRTAWVCHHLGARRRRTRHKNCGNARL